MLLLDGCHTAIITPFKNGEIDYQSYEKIINFQIERGINGIVVAGTTGESPTLGFDEHKKLIKFTVKTVAKRCLVIAGTGANSTAEAISLTQYAEKIGANASLQVTPYYNKPTQRGLIQHFEAILQSTDIPLILYNVPGRTSLALEIDTVKKLSEYKNIIAIKEAAGSVDRVSQILSQCNDMIVLSGDDSLTLPMISVGAKGAISVLSNAYPKEMTQLVKLALQHSYQEAQTIHHKYYNLMNKMFIQTNPIPIKTLMAHLGFCDETMRLPLCSMNSNDKEQFLESIKTNLL